MSWFSKTIGKNPLAVISPVFAATSGLLGGKKSGGFTPTQTELLNPFEQEQAKQLYEQTQSAYNQQQAFVNALAQQNALANQANVFRQLQDVASGVGPNPALAALQQATGENIAGQAALMAGQRGAGRNVGLLARQAGMQGGALQQQAAGQGATMQAQQQLAALGQLGGLANQQVAQQQAGLGALGQMGLSGQQNILQALAQQNAARLNQQNAINQINAQMAAERARSEQAMLGGALGAIGTIAGTAFGGPVGGAIGGNIANVAAPKFDSYKFGQYSFAKGGEVKKPQYADGELAGIQPQSFIGQYFQNPNQALNAINQSDNLKDSQLDYSTLNDGGAVNRDGMYAKGGMAPMSLMDQGGKVPGKAAVAGDSYKNDIVDAKLSPGEIVIPRSIVNHPNAPEMAAQFVRDTLSKKKGYADGGEVKDDLIYLGDPKQSQYIPDVFEETKPTKEFVPFKEPELKKEVKPVSTQTGIDISKTQPSISERTPTAIQEKLQEPVQLEQVSPVARGFEAEKQAYLESGKLAEQQAREQEIKYEKSFKELEAQQLRYNYEIKEINNELNNVRSDIMQSKIDPQRFISNMSTGNKIGTAIGLILGGIGSGLTGGENVVLKQLNNYIEQDLFAQKAELGKKENLLSALTQKYGNVNQAMQAARIMIGDSISLQMKRVASKYAGKIEQQRLNAVIAGLDDDTAYKIDNFAKQRMNTPESGLIESEFDPRRTERVDVGNEPLYAGSEAEAKEAKEKLYQINLAEQAVADMENLRAQFGGKERAAKIAAGLTYGLKDTEYEKKGERLKSKLAAAFAPIYFNKPTKITEEEREEVKNLMPDPFRLFEGEYLNALNSIKNTINQRKNLLKKCLYLTQTRKKSKESKEIFLKKPEVLEE
jgi:hypothetical protein